MTMPPPFPLLLACLALGAFAAETPAPVAIGRIG